MTVDDILGGLTAAQRADADALVAMLGTATGAEPTLWPGKIIGFGTYRYRHASGRSGTMPQIGFAPRAGKFVLYLSDDLTPFEPLLARLGAYSSGQGCLYLKSLHDVDSGVLRQLVDQAIAARPDA